MEEEARVAYIQNRLFEAKGSSSIWRELRSLGLIPKPKEELNGFSPNDLNRHFAGVSISDVDESSTQRDIIASACEDGFRFREININDVILSISHFSSQAKGEDGIPQSVLVKALPVIGQFIVRIFNSSLCGGVFPALWKQAHVVPLKKKPIPSSAADFRPIALLCFLSKVLEKIAHTQITDHLQAEGLLDPMQAGFRKHHSTETALLKLTDDIRTGIDKRRLTLLLLFDFSKAFDTVSHTRLLSKLRRLGFSRSALTWLLSYLTGRKQMVNTHCSGNSDWLNTNLGVPQGSVLGPLLFCLYVNDLRDSLDLTRTQYLLYADDLQIYIQVPRDGLDEGITTLGQAARAVSRWAADASLRLNTSKTQAILFGSQRFVNGLSESGLPEVDLGDGVSIPFSETVTSLGVVLDAKLTWRPHVDLITKKFNRVLYGLRFFRQYTTEPLRRKLAETLLFPHLDYCSVVFLDASLEQRTRLQVLQNACVRYVFGVRRDEHISPYRDRLGWLRTDTRRSYFMSVLLYKILRIGEPSYLSALFCKHQPRGLTRGEVKELSVPAMRTETGTRSFQAQAARFWNELPSSLRYLPSLQQFKSSIRLHLSRTQ